MADDMADLAAEVRALQDRALKLETSHEMLSDRHDEFRQEMRTEVQSLRKDLQEVKAQQTAIVTGMGELKTMLKNANDDRSAKDQALKLTVWAANTLGPYLILVLVAAAAYLKGHLG
ncbi:hypothetical protein [Gluconobacter morbifer]|uniref:Uncharacterized protein n=1 Tax=Gluconobacter morbifer G707 TaxID=1088869 RepID=G6XIQ5_9PROT|nr:hypothetical protein [Gluconobacter morbifer]EHH68363.1 hypothetical protein GMO_11330 [Gluconobacter morbifer G707]